MSKAKPIDLGLKHVDELFMDDAERAELKLPRIHDICSLAALLGVR